MCNNQTEYSVESVSNEMFAWWHQAITWTDVE